MKSREIVERTLSFRHPERIAMSLPDPYPNDFVGAGIATDPEWRPPLDERGPDGRTWIDEWGVTWRSLTEIDKGEVYRGAFESWEDFDAWEPPDITDPVRYERAIELFRGDREHYRIGSLPGFPFNIARKLRRMDQYLADLMLEPARISRLHGLLADLLTGAIERWAEAGADAVMFAEDWGMQDRLLIDPDQWRRIFKPDFVSLCETAHRRGLRVLMHSCGYIRDIIPDLAEAGIDCLQLDQPRLSGIEWLGREFGGRLTFWCPVDIQSTLQSGDPELVESDARRMIEVLGGKGGGFIAGYYGGNEAIGVDPALQDVACRAFVRYGGAGMGAAEGPLPARG